VASDGSTTRDSDLGLLRKARNGDLEALSELLVRLDPALRRRMRGQIPARHRGAFDEDDVLQVTYCEAFLRFTQFAGNDTVSFLSWITRAAENNLRDAIRELERAKRPPRKHQLKLSFPDDSYAVFLQELVAAGTTPTRHARRAEIQNVITDALADLPPDYARVVRLYDLDGRSIADVAKELGRRPGAVHMLRQRARERLRELLGDESRFFSRAE
jgi:RNA polymerase sigma-70 factor (subfamily 1)